MCGLVDNRPIEHVESEILEYKKIGVDDTIVASLSGKIYDKLVYNNIDKMPSELPYSNVWAKEVYTDSIIGIVTNEKGEYSLVLAPSTYDIEVQFVGYNNLKIENQKIGTGELLSCSILLGSGYGKTSYKLDSLLKPIKIDNIEE